MVKGISRRVIVVKSPDPRFFDEAIFIMKEDSFRKEGMTADQVVREAQRVADGYVRRNNMMGKKLGHIPPVFYAAGGALAACACWVLALFL